ncbi:PAS domain-containing protein [Lujinxingia sediminis]|uniref:histidine kinase n=2 Tax=Lujinxingia sediminis TaxID=2480984 RepID=A0ABY0CRN7_9DELT|nr:PAS domain-containing protein [Lujinxingia sediminis]
MIAPGWRGNHDVGKTCDEDEMAARYILSQPLALAVDVAMDEGLDVEALAQGLELDLKAVQRTAYMRVPWESFAIFLERMEEALGGAFVPAMTRRYLEQNPFRNFMRVGGLFCSPQLFYKMANHVFGPMMFPLLRFEVEELGNLGFRVVTTLPPDVRDCPVFFRICGEFLRHGPALVGMAPARAHYVFGVRRATFQVDYPPSLSLLARLRRFSDAALASRAFMEELQAQGERLRESYDALQESEESFRTLVERSPDGVMVLHDSGIIFANDALARMLALRRGLELVGKHMETIGAPGYDVSALLQQALEHGEAVALRLREPGDDAAAAVPVEARALRARFLGRDALIATLRDVREREASMARAIDTDRLVTMGTLAAGVAHEINTPLSYVQANLDFLSELLEDITDRPELDAAAAADVHASLRDARKGVERAIEITRDLKEVGREGESRGEVLDPRLSVEGALRWARAEVLHVARLQMALEACGEVMASRRRLSQVVLNLLINAAHAMNSEERQRNLVEVTTFASADHACIEVCDNGPGMAPETLERVFEPFYTTKEPGRGTGLGLFVSREIVEEFGGTLHLESEPGRGTRATIRLPQHQEATRSTAETSAS